MGIKIRTVKADSICEGDQFLNEEGYPAWTAISDAAVVGTEVVINVQHPDGGLESRHFPRDIEWSVKFVRRVRKTT